MMKAHRYILGIDFCFLILAVLMISCKLEKTEEAFITAVSKTQTQTQTQAATWKATKTIQRSPSVSPTPSFTDTPLYRTSPKSTSTITYTPTAFPTFDINSVQTHVPFPTAQCPVEDPDYEVQLGELSIDMFAKDLDEIYLGALEDGASINQVADAIADQFDGKTYVDILDLTWDGIPEVVVRDFFNDVIIGCSDGEYKIIATIKSGSGSIGSPYLQIVPDMNLDGMPEILAVYRETSGSNATVEIFEWDGIKFNSMIQAFHGKNSNKTYRLARALYWYEEDWLGYGENWGFAPSMNGGADVDVIDTDHNGTKELILTDGGPVHRDTLYNYGPWRGKKVTFKWDGIHYLYSDLEIDPPEYRFQAVQDADRLFLLGKYDEALEMYQEVIFSDKLDWWSAEKMDNLADAHFTYSGTPSPTPLPEDSDEYMQLSAYARYRIVVNHVAQGWLGDAQTVNQTLQEKYPEGTIGHEFAEWATLFLDEYQKSQDLKAACTVVVENADRHSEMLSPLGNFEHGDQSHIYKPEDVCPFTVDYE